MTQQTGNEVTGLRVGEAAADLGVGVQTLHYYEREELIPAPPRSEAGYRIFPPDLMERLRFIRRAQALGLSLSEIKETLDLAEIGESPCGRVQAALTQKLEEVDRRLTQLMTFREQLRDLIEHAPRLQTESPAARVCKIVEHADPITGVEITSRPLAQTKRCR
ncbi:MAG TPA: heavy metal-responsive transcriptional regulator [Longimicrobiaceae bacterium]|nr:heavy metal-responsive transcriptional regulator [Longimicrobiaceae bacterium]